MGEYALRAYVLGEYCRLSEYLRKRRWGVLAGGVLSRRQVGSTRWGSTCSLRQSITRIYGSVAQTVQSRTVLYLRLIYPNPKQISTKCATEPFARLSHKYKYGLTDKTQNRKIGKS